MAVDTSYLTTQVNNIVEQLHGIFDEIGIPNHERDSREAEVCSVSALSPQC
jgi:protein regulator of cytokinesis 1